MKCIQCEGPVRNNIRAGFRWYCPQCKLNMREKWVWDGKYDHELERQKLQIFLAKFLRVQVLSMQSSHFAQYIIKPQKKIELDGKLTCRQLKVPFFEVAQILDWHPRKFPFSHVFNQQDVKEHKNFLEKTLVGKTTVITGYFQYSKLKIKKIRVVENE